VNDTTLPRKTSKSQRIYRITLFPDPPITTPHACTLKPYLIIFVQIAAISPKEDEKGKIEEKREIL